MAFPPHDDGGARALTIDEIPLEWCFQRGVKLDFRAFPDGYVVTAQDVEDELASAMICNRSTSCWSTRRRAWRWASPTM
jgi:hypothetical protein